MKIAVLLSGNIRTWERSNLLDFIDLDVDYFISTTNKKYNYHPFINNKFGYHNINDELIDDENIKKLFNKINYKKLLISDDDVIIDENFSPNMRNLDSCYHQYNRIKKILNDIEDYENNNNFKYDLILKTRIDLIYYGKLSQNIYSVFNTDYVMYEDGCDSDIISNRNDFFNIVNHVVDEFYNQSDLQSHIHPPHSMLNSAVKKFNLRNLNKKNTDVIRF